MTRSTGSSSPRRRRSFRWRGGSRRGSARLRRCSRRSACGSGFVVAPTDAQQGDAYRIIFIHVPAAWMSMFIYLVMAFWCALSLAFNTRLSAMMAQALAPTGALLTFLALWTGALWGRPDVGHVLGVGRAHDLGADPAVPVLRRTSRCATRSTIRAAPIARARCSRWSAWSTCRSSISRSSGGTRCTRARRSA